MIVNNFEDYFQRKLVEDKEELENSSLSLDDLREIYRNDWEYEQNRPHLELKMEGQNLDYETVKYYLPQKWEMPRPGKLLYSDEELQRVLELIVFNLGIKNSLGIIPKELIEQYLKKK